MPSTQIIQILKIMRSMQIIRILKIMRSTQIIQILKIMRVDSQLTKSQDSQLTKLHLHFASTKSSMFFRLASSQLIINVGRRGTNQLRLLERYLDVLVKHTTEDPAPGCLSRRRIVKMINFKL
jgi:hypothetical protein